MAGAFVKHSVTASDEDDSEKDQVHEEHSKLKDKVCQPCYRDEINENAIGYCVDCQEFLCSECFIVHKKPAPLRNHVLLDKYQVDQQKTPLHIKDVCLDTCKTHKDEVLKYICTDHETLACSVCMTLVHKYCMNTQYIPEAAHGFLESTQVSEFEKELNELNEKTLTNMAKSNGIDSLINNMGTDTLKALSKWKEDMNEVILNVEKEVKEKVATLQNTDREALDLLKRKYEATRNDLIALSSKTDIIKNNGQNCQMFIKIQTMKRSLTQYRETLEEAENNFKLTRYMLKPNSTLQDVLQNNKNFGEVKTFQNSLTVCHVKDINVKMKSDENICSIGCMVSIDPSVLIMTDFNNKNVKVLEIDSEEIQTVLSFESGPWYIAILEDEKFAITLPTDNKIVIVKRREQDLQLEKEIDCKRKILGITSIDDNRLIATSVGNIDVIDLDGKQLKTLISSNRLFPCPLHVSYNEKESCIYVSDETAHTVTKLSLYGQILHTYTDDNLKAPDQILVNKDGTSFVCGVDSNNVHALSIFCKKSGIILDAKDALQKPRSIVFCDSTDMLFVGGTTDSIKMFRLS